MKLSMFLITVFCLQVSAKVFSQKINISEKNVAVSKVINLIQQQSGYEFFYDNKDLQRKSLVTVDLRNASVKEALDDLFKDGSFTYTIEDNTIIITTGKEKRLINFTVSGNITDEKGLPLIGVTIKVKGSNLGSQSDANGHYQINVPESSVLIFSYIGFKTREVSITNQQILNISLQLDQGKLNEVVVVGYGSQSSKYITGATTSIKANSLEQFPATSIEQSLSGKVPGVQFLQSSGQPGAGFSVRIRGVSSISGGNEPLYVIDGVPFFNNDVRNSNGLNGINPNDIESIDVLKDASSTAIYGSRGGNGVIMITTKSGKANKSFIQYNSWVGFSEPIRKLNLMSGDQYKAFVQAYYQNSSTSLPSDFATIKNNNTDWQNEVFQKAFKQNHELIFSGGNEKNKYYSSFNYDDQKGIIINSGFKRYSFFNKTDNNITDIFSVHTSLIASHTEQNGAYPADNNNTLSLTKTGLGSVILALPTEPVYNSLGNYSNIFPYSFSGQLENPLAYLKESTDKYTDNRLFASTVLTAKVSSFLNNNLRIGVNYLSRRNDQYFPKILQVVYSSLGYAILDTKESVNVVGEDYLELKVNLLRKLSFNATVGASLESQTDKSYHIEGQGFISDDLKDNAIQAAATTSVPQTNLSQRGLASIFARTVFNYDEKYILEGSLRSDGASVFSENHKTATFPAVAFSWLINNENFLKNSNTINTAKVRVSWGQSGNQAIQPYQSLNIGSLVSSSQAGNGGLVVGIAPNLPNQNITWETSTQFNTGFDLGLFKSKLQLVFDYYDKTTEGALSTVQLAPSSGFNTIIDNIGKVKNKGFEFGIDLDLFKTNDFKLSTGFNISQNTNTVVQTKNHQTVSDFLASGNYSATTNFGYSAITEGLPLGAIYAYKFTGFNGAGVPQYFDVNSDGKIDANDLQYIGNPYPKYLYGFNLTTSYKKLSLSMNWQGVAKAQLYDLNQLNLTSPNVSFNRSQDVYSYYPNAKIGIPTYADDRYEEDASFLRLKNIRIDYTIPLLNKVFKRINIYASAQNILTITNYKGYDPEVNSFNGSDLKQGIDNGAYPTAKSYTLGLNIQY